ncbi:uncharacterized protein N7473_003187 [Penicillium subrubescens]|uniref:DNA repair protein XRCC4 n=1 Tax=Penicillium subrubescens TaxID=1316194 RepID=A0A1Q5UAA0_9EURO|nr:uncharacterized protein N7473_003187 [Penicillium subrubescens]KAJ5906271.1 hypothetical protein N7473_003187 [Penicillium subrubescens]OKP09403.1 hypothetical protein PENSUB_5225 [Penicillium subrubescens]
MSTPQVLRIPRSDEPHSYVLVHVSQTGQAPLDVSLTATEGENPYAASIKQSRLQALRGKKYQGSDDEWAYIIAYVLRQPISTENASWSAGIEVSASISSTGGDEQEIVITIRKRVQDITQRLGSLVLKQDEDQEIALFEWTGLAAAKADALHSQVTSLTDRYRTAEDTIAKLTQQLADLMQAKSQHENQMVVNFAQLLNEKKLKIRNQQRLLASAAADPTKVAEIQAATVKHEATSSQPTTKRRAADTLADEDESDDGFERMDVDRKAADVQAAYAQETEDEEERGTPQPLEDGEGNTTTDDEDEEVPATSQRSVPERAKVRTSERQAPAKEAAPAPPRRELPFTRRGPAAQAQAQAQVQPQPLAETSVAGEETEGETDDDEL